MPSYEPTPRRFSVISVSRSASRRNSIDDPARPSLAQDPPRSCEAPTAINLTDALKLLQHVEVDEDRERGRSRQSADHIEPKVVLGHDGAVGAPFARRDNSASTRERIAVWEERSRSQSKGRSKSRGRDLGAGSRISIVPEVPELAAAFARFGRDKTELAGTGAVDIAAEDIETEKHDVRKRTSPRPQTPPRGCDDLLPTPDATPKRVASTSNGISPTIEIRKESQRWTGPEIQLPSEMPATPVQSGTAILPLTPEATPESHQSRTKGSTHVVTESESDRETLVAAYSNIFHRDGDSGWGEPNTVEPRRNPKLPSDSPVKATGIVDRTVSPNTRQKIGSGPDHRQEPDPQYHQVWRISSYEPDFPLPSRLSQTTGSTLPKEGHFDGNPLQQLPQSQQPTGVAAYRPRITSNAYPYRTDSTSSSRDWIVNVPNMTDQQRRHDHPPRHHEWDAPPVIERAIHAASVSMIQGLQVPLELYRGLREVYYPPPNRPNITKAYPIRRRLPVRIFFPTHHDLTSPTLLPTLFTIHGGAFTLGTPQDDDIWNRTFSDAHTILVISLNYSKSPWVSFPAPLKDLEAIYHSALNDDSLPIDRMRTAILGFDAGANLALGLSQLPSVKSGIDPSSSSSGTRKGGSSASCFCCCCRVGLFGSRELASCCGVERGEEGGSFTG
ncbi:hypothetical protein QBC44DRAFT_344649 [Cladorrhinum sp. PSN332]|nr:hypothetical protein QBC44DRAFT_344649 [Cladorrhinum sp. PSN332]